ncbi:glutamate racemase [Haemophilus influenzae]|uniref:Glutamate racemase n=1 Tax=Haemophilus influenzae TaxID=727 RepID=A0A2X1QNL7_HAEIF|nr:glutamate racemase [Haemophilus influenzae]
MNKKEKRPTVLFFDSGVGGFSVYREAKKTITKLALSLLF